MNSNSNKGWLTKMLEIFNYKFSSHKIPFLRRNNKKSSKSDNNPAQETKPEAKIDSETYKAYLNLPGMKESAKRLSSGNENLEFSRRRRIFSPEDEKAMNTMSLTDRIAYKKELIEKGKFKLLSVEETKKYEEENNVQNDDETQTPDDDN